MAYDRLAIDHIGSGCKNLVVNAEHAHVSIGFNENYHADFDVIATYARFIYGDRVAARVLSDGDNTKIYSDKIGNEGSAKVVIKEVYGSVSFM